MSLHGAGHPEAVNVEIAVCLNRHPGVFSRNIFNKAFPAFLAAIENKSIIKALSQPFLFCNTLLAGHGAADMFLVNIFFCDTNIVHPFFLLIKTAVPAASAFLLLEKWREPHMTRSHMLLSRFKRQD